MDNPDVIVVGIHQNDSPDLVQDFREQTGVTFPLLGDQGTLWQFSFPEGVGYPYPRDVIVGKDLRVRAIRNSFDVGEWTQLVEELLAE
jgi:hypothetical protein